MKKLSVALSVGVIMLGMVSLSFGTGTLTVDDYPKYIDGDDTSAATPFAIHISITGMSSESGNLYIRAYPAFVWTGSQWSSTHQYNSTHAYTIDIGTATSWNGWVYLKSFGSSAISVKARKGETSSGDTNSVALSGITLLNMSSGGSWIYDSGNPPAGKVIVALDGSGNILGTWVAEDNGITDQFPSAANYPGSPATGFWEMSVPAPNISIAKLQARNADNTVYAEDTTPGWNSGSAGEPHELLDASLPVTLSSFTAISTDSVVMLKWRTESEVDNMGWNIYRCETKDGKFVKINDKLIPGAGNSAMPNSYQFVDKTVVKGRQYYYYLEDVDITGMRNKSSVISSKDAKKLTTTWSKIKKG